MATFTNWAVFRLVPTPLSDAHLFFFLSTAHLSRRIKFPEITGFKNDLKLRIILWLELHDRSSSSTMTKRTVFHKSVLKQL